MPSRKSLLDALKGREGRAPAAKSEEEFLSDMYQRIRDGPSDHARHSAIHQMSMIDSMMKMRQVTERLPVPENGAVMLEPGSYHLMFNDLKRPLQQGEHFSATLVFEKAGKIDVTFEVQGLGAGAPKD